MVLNDASAFRERFLKIVLRGVIGLTASTPAIALVQGKCLLHEFRENHRDMPFPDMPCSGVVVVHPKTYDRQKRNLAMNSSNGSSTGATVSSWFPEFPLLREQQEPNPLRLLVVGDSLAAGVGVTKSGTPVLPEEIAKSLSSALGGRAVYWTCMGEPGLSSPQIVKELLLAEDDVRESEANEAIQEEVDVMQELKEWWEERRRQQEHEEEQWKKERQQLTQHEKAAENVPGQEIRSWWRRARRVAEKDIQELREKIHWRELGGSIRKRIKKTKTIPESSVIFPLKRRNTIVADLVAQYDIAVVCSGFNDIKNAIFPLPDDPNDTSKEVTIREKADIDGVTASSWFEKDLLSIMEALKGKMRNYGIAVDLEKSAESQLEEVNTANDTPKKKAADSVRKITTQDPTAGQSLAVRGTRRHHPMVVFPATPLFAKKVYPLSWFAEPIIRLLEYQKKKLAEKYPAPVLFLDVPDRKAMSDYTNKRGPLWEARSREEVLLELRSKARLEKLESLMRDYYDMWTLDVEEEEATYTYDEHGPDIRGPMQCLQRSPLISPDNVHPSDEGYELWGRHIADAIVKQWDKGDHRYQAT